MPGFTALRQFKALLSSDPRWARIAVAVVNPDHAPVGSRKGTAMRKEPGFLEVFALVCTIIATVLAIADWMLKLM